MIESLQSCQLLLAAEKNFSVPHGVLTMDKNGSFIPHVPFFYYDSIFYKTPTDVSPDISSDAQGYWATILEGVRHLINPFTKFNRAPHDVCSSALRTYEASVKIQRLLPNSKIVLPLQIAFGPDQTGSKELNICNHIFRYNAFSPPEYLPIQNVPQKNGPDVKRIVFDLDLTPSSTTDKSPKTHTFHLDLPVTY
jgi:hypothetical protein